MTDTKKGVGKFVCLKGTNHNAPGFHLMYDQECKVVDKHYRMIVDDWCDWWKTDCLGLDTLNYYYIEYELASTTTTTIDPDETTTTIPNQTTIIPTTTNPPCDGLFEGIIISFCKQLKLKKSKGKIKKYKICCNKQYSLQTKNHEYCPKNPDDILYYRHCSKVYFTFILLDTLNECACTIHVDCIECIGKDCNKF